MLSSIEAGDRRILIVTALLLVALSAATAVISPQGETDPGFPSTYSPAPGGAKGAFLLLKELGYEVERWERSPAELPEEAEGMTLLLADPFLGISDGEREAIHRFVKAGGRVIATGEEGAKLAGIPAGKTPAPEDNGGPDDYGPAIAGPLARDAARIRMTSEVPWRDEGGAVVGFFGGDDATVAAALDEGEGRLYWWGAATPLTNDGIRIENNLELLLGSIGPPDEVFVLWDEYYHGHRGSLVSYFSGTPVPWGMLHAAVALLAACATWGRRAGPVRSPSVESRLTPLEFVDTVGDLYRRARATGGAVEIAHERFRRLIVRRLGLPANAAAVAIQEAAVRKLGRRGEGLLRTLRECESARADPLLDEWKALQLVQALHIHENALLAGAGHLKETD